MLQKHEKIYLSPPHMSGNEMTYINEAFETNWIAPLGNNVDEFENELSTLVGAGDGVAVSSGTAAIHLALSLLGISRGDKVFCSTLTFIASANPIVYQGAEPIFIDSEPDTWNMSPQALNKALEEAIYEGWLPKAVIVVNLYGQSAKMDELLTLCSQFNIPLIEDAAESLGSIYKGRASGTLGKFGIYSFNGNKIITTSGGGMLISDDKELISKARFLSAQARDKARHYQHSKLGYNYRMSNILAGIGRAQLQVLGDRVEKRRSIFEGYSRELDSIPGIQFMPELKCTKSNRWLTALTIDNEILTVKPSQIVDYLNRFGIEARPVWKPLHLQPFYEHARYYSHGENESVSERLFRSGICLPSGSNLSFNEQEFVIHTFKQAIFESKQTYLKEGII